MISPAVLSCAAAAPASSIAARIPLFISPPMYPWYHVRPSMTARFVTLPGTGPGRVILWQADVLAEDPETVARGLDGLGGILIVAPGSRNVQRCCSGISGTRPGPGICVPIC